jgi:hypothetical protein
LINFNGDMGEIPDSPRAIKDRKYRRTHPSAKGGKKRRGQSHHGRNGNLRLRFENGELNDFTAWDGEGYTDNSGVHHYMLFGSSNSTPIVSPSLSTLECLQHIEAVCKAHPKNINVAFAFEYDVNMILRDLSILHLRILNKYGTCHYRGYTIEHIPHKMFTVWPGGLKKSQRYVIFDMFEFFKTSFIQALKDWRLGDSAEMGRIVEGKGQRGQFTYEEIDYVKAYWTDEIKLLARLADNLRDTFYNAGFFITSWHGCGALAAYMMDHNGVKEHMSRRNPKKTPAGVKVAMRHAYAGGRFQEFHGGEYDGTVYCADLNSAYVTAARMLPSLATGQWNRGNTSELRNSRSVPDFGIYRIKWDFLHVPYTRRPQPFFFRYKSGHLSWPDRGEGWYWGPEINAALAIGAEFQLEEAWIYQDDGTRPFAGWINGAYQRRLERKRAKDPVEFTYKAGLAALYGQWAQRVGWNRKSRTAPSRHQLEWAGFITSWCRAQMERVAASVGIDNLVSIDTDGVTALAPFKELDIGDQLGQWKVDEYEGIVQWQSGIYWLKKDRKWSKSKSRGMPKGEVSRERCIEQLRALDLVDFYPQKASTCTIKTERPTFVGYRTALHGMQLNRWRKWETNYPDSTFGSSAHVSSYCYQCGKVNPTGSARGFPHPMHSMLNPLPTEDGMSCQHKLPWLQPEKEDDWSIEGALAFDELDQDYVEILHDIDM